MKYDYGFKSNNADEFACIACVACVDRIKVKIKVNGCCEGLRSKGLWLI